MKKSTKSRDVTFWLNEIEAAKKREKNYRKEGQKVLEIYEGKDPDKIPFNILYSNTETLHPALYSSVPRPVVRRRFKDADPVGMEAAKAGTRILEFLLDTNIDGYETFDDGMKASTLDALLPGRGVLSVKYDAEVVESDSPYKKSELVCIDTRSWDKTYFGYAKKWSRVPWVCYEEQIDKKESIRLFGETVAKELVYSKDEPSEKDRDSDSDDRNTGEKKTTTIYQIWDKDGGRKIRYISPGYPKVLKVEDDTLELTGFFDCPKPLRFIDKVNDLIPISLYQLYENQAKELNRLTRRINRIIEAIKARGVYDGELGEDIANLMKADDNELVPADKSSSLAAEKGLDNAIWFMPIEKLIIVLQQLYVAREACKQVIYEITGIADVMRGQSKASETLGAQEIKTQWGTLRIKPKQAEVARYARDILRMMLEVAASKFSEDTWAKMTGLPYLTTEQSAQLQQMAAALQKQIPIQPELEEQLQKVQEELQKPTWTQVLDLLKNDLQRAYRIDIETNSTVLPEAAEDQKQISEFMMAMGQFLNGVGPLVAQGVLPFEVAQTMLLTITRRFRFGEDIEAQIMQMQPPQQDGQAEADAAKAQAEADAKMKQDEHALKMQEGQMKFQLAQQHADAEKESIRLQMIQSAKEHEFKMEELESKHAVNMETGRMKLATMKQQQKQPQA